MTPVPDDALVTNLGLSPLLAARLRDHLALPTAGHLRSLVKPGLPLEVALQSLSGVNATAARLIALALAGGPPGPTDADLEALVDAGRPHSQEGAGDA